jgi:hypothetical protein
MKLTITSLFIAIAILLVAASPSFAATPMVAVNGTAPDAECQPGADNDIVSGWMLLSLEQYAAFLVEEHGVPSYEMALEIAERTYAFCDHNGDNYACVMEQNFPNDASGSSNWLLIEDNHPFGGK